MHLSIVVPAYNEGKVLKANLEKIITYLKSKKYTWEIVVVDDGSRDNTFKIAKTLSNNGVKAYVLPLNQGKGGALKEGFDKANGEYVIFMDADLSVPLKNIDIFLSELRKYKVVIGSRRLSGSNIVVHQPFFRESMGRVFTLLTKIVTSTNLADYTCGFKGFEKNAGKKIFAQSKIKRWSYDAEIMFLAHKFGYKIKQIPVEWFNRVDSRVRLSDAVITSFLDLIKIRVYDLLGKYDY
jgi:dolichyl-phosphate beta-glucosyltransferase